MITKTRLAMTTLALALVLGGCSSSPSSNGEASGTENGKNGVQEISVYTTNSPDRLWVKKLSSEFEKTHKNIKVKIIEVPFDNFDSKLQTMLASNTPPDITTHIGWAGFSEYMSKDQLLDLSPYMDSFNAAELGIPEELMKIFQVNGKQYAIPLQAFVSLMLYNKDLFDKAGIPYPPSSYDDATWTWDKMLEDAKKLTVVSNDITKVQYGLSWAWSGGGREQDPQYFGHDVFPADTFTSNKGLAAENFFGNPDVTNDLQKLADLVLKDKVAPPAEFSVGGSDAFLAGKIAMAVDGAWRLSGVNDAGFRMGVAAIPMGGNSKVRDVLWTDGYWIFKGSKHPEAAFEWIKFMAQKENQEQMIELSGGSPSASQLALDKYANFFKGVDPTEIKNVVNGGIQYGAEGYAHLMPGSGEMHTLIDNELNPVFNGSKKASQVTPELQQKLNTMLEKNRKRDSK
ncbi:ABC transporter substrate-binding protein [Cohnella sp. REN36]|uniref:ABC transporter substrate-binding protein n=1 Tax=Cohnella sp. REN36 TaxID=2887347 RepID=UPI001D14AE2E|nr:sugar ABC transporter substrate-binding protein [Cohnella sp. REN36]MCC3374187.1 sugar ABC transporter substrate-binding protein [Cohnella sp. REN36]